MSVKEFFPEIGRIAYESPGSKNPRAFHCYEPERAVCCKKMKGWFKFSTAWWHTLCAGSSERFGAGTKSFPWNRILLLP